MNMLTVRDRIRGCVHTCLEQAALAGDFTVGGFERAEQTLIPAAVLIPIVLRPEGYTVLLTQRAAHLEHHAGQISFPGGHAEPDDPSPAHTALRETAEEIGLQREHVIEVAGFLDLYQTITGFLITPVVALIAPPFTLHLDSSEVAEAFEVPLDFLFDPQHHVVESLWYDGQMRNYYAISYEDHRIWGATAAMLVGFARRFAAFTEEEATP